MTALIRPYSLLGNIFRSCLPLFLRLRDSDYLKQNQNSTAWCFSSPGAFNNNTKLAPFKTRIAQSPRPNLISPGIEEMQLVHQLRLDKGAPGYSCRLSLQTLNMNLLHCKPDSLGGGDHDPSKQVGILFQSLSAFLTGISLKCLDCLTLLTSLNSLPVQNTNHLPS